MNKTKLMVLIFLLLAQTLFAYDLISSSEVGNHVLRELSLEGLGKEESERRFTQEDGKQFLIKKLPEQQRISIIPEVLGLFEEKSRSSWEIGFNVFSDIESITVYLQSKEDSFLEFFPNELIADLSITIRGKKVFSEVKIPIALKDVFGMAMQEFMRVTQKTVPWDWFIPSADNFENYSGKENIAGFLQQNFKARSFYEIEYYSAKNKEVQWYAYTLIDFVNALLSFSGGDEKLEFLQFFPLQENRKKLLLSDPTFLARYTTNVVNYLSKKGEFLATEIFMPSRISLSPSLDNLEVQLYLLAVRYPSYFFLVSIDQVSSTGARNSRETRALRVYIPYFTPSGAYSYYQADFSLVEAAVVDETSTNNNYFFEVTPLNLPYAYDVRYE